MGQRRIWQHQEMFRVGIIVGGGLCILLPRRLLAWRRRWKRSVIVGAELAAKLGGMCIPRYR